MIFYNLLTQLSNNAIEPTNATPTTDGYLVKHDGIPNANESSVVDDDATIDG